MGPLPIEGKEDTGRAQGSKVSMFAHRPPGADQNYPKQRMTEIHLSKLDTHSHEFKQ